MASRKSKKRETFDEEFRAQIAIAIVGSVFVSTVAAASWWETRRRGGAPAVNAGEHLALFAQPARHRVAVVAAAVAPPREAPARQEIDDTPTGSIAPQPAPAGPGGLPPAALQNFRLVSISGPDAMFNTLFGPMTLKVGEEAPGVGVVEAIETSGAFGKVVLRSGDKVTVFELGGQAQAR
ncbi:MAG: hypothetical protein KGL46_10295 [Hyphomicrobiales bacterium]|nr:hypothetical protein [Hyphomicrobiales bacterium]